MKKSLTSILVLSVILFLCSCHSTGSSNAGKSIVGIWEKANENDFGNKIIEFKENGTIYFNGDSAGHWEIASSISKNKKETDYLVEKLNVGGDNFSEITLLDESHLNLARFHTETKYIRH